MRKLRAGFRLLFYFKIGYSAYFAMLVGVINILTSSYFLLVENVPALKSIMPTFGIYVALLVLIGIPVVTVIGWMHFKQTPAFSAQASINAQHHPYQYQFAPGFEVNVFGPAYRTILRANIKRLTGEQFSKKELVDMDKIERDLQSLIDGGSSGKPPKGVI